MYLTEKTLRLYLLTAVYRYTEDRINQIASSNLSQEEYLAKTLPLMAMENEAIRTIEDMDIRLGE